MAEAALKQEPGLEPEEVEDIAAGKSEEPKAPKEAKEPAEKAEKPDKGKEKPEPQKTVPHEAFHEERKARQALERTLKEREKAWEEKESRLNARLDQIFAAREQPQPKAPDLTRDPIGYVRSLEQRVAAQEQETLAQRTEREKAENQYREDQRVWGVYGQSVNAFRKVQPDNDAAVGWLADVRRNQLRAFGMNPGDIERTIQAEERQAVFSAYQRGDDPAEMLYKWAVATGWKPEMAQKPNGNGQAQESAIDRLKAAQDASETLGKGGSATATTGRITLETLFRMSENELQAFISKMNAKDPDGYEKFKRKLEGGY